MRKVVIAVAGCWMIFSIVCGCRSRSNGRILSQDTMQVVLTEMLKADAYNDILSIKDTNYRHDTAYALLYADIWGAHHISRKQFSDSYDYYMSKPAELKELIDSMSNEANRAFAKEGEIHPKGAVPPVRGSGIGQPGWQSRPVGPAHPFVLPAHPVFPRRGAPLPHRGTPLHHRASPPPHPGSPPPAAPVHH